jgi:hypothetical protein
VTQRQYVVVVEGVVSTDRLHQVATSVVQQHDDCTSITITTHQQADLHDVLQRLHDLGLILVSVTYVDAGR